MNTTNGESCLVYPKKGKWEATKLLWLDKSSNLVLNDILKLCGWENVPMELWMKTKLKNKVNLN